MSMADLVAQSIALTRKVLHSWRTSDALCIDVPMVVGTPTNRSLLNEKRSVLPIINLSHAFTPHAPASEDLVLAISVSLNHPSKSPNHGRSWFAKPVIGDGPPALPMPMPMCLAVPRLYSHGSRPFEVK